MIGWYPALVLTLTASMSVGALPRESRAGEALKPSVRPGAALILGEVHGTNEAPQLLERFVIESMRPLIVGVEMPDELISSGCDVGSEPPDVWRNYMPDGRSSVAMRDLVCRLIDRALEDRITFVGLDGGHRDQRAYAERSFERLSEAIAGQPDAAVIVLTGNFHSRNVPGSLADRLRAVNLEVTTATIIGLHYEAWYCDGTGRDSCGLKAGVTSYCGDTEADANPTWKLPPASSFPWDRCVVFDRLTSSEPAFGLR